MANQEHLDILNQGVDAWNEWRQHHQELQPDLSKASFNDINLSYINLNHTYLNGSNLSRANLSEAVRREVM